MEIQNTLDCFVLLWRMLERTRRLLQGHCKRFCIRNVLKAWFDCEANDNFIWEVCLRCEQAGWDELPVPSLYPLKHRELLRSLALSPQAPRTVAGYRRRQTWYRYAKSGTQGTGSGL